MLAWSMLLCPVCPGSSCGGSGGLIGEPRREGDLTCIRVRLATLLLQGLSPDVDAEQLQRHAAAAFGAVLAAEVDISDRDRPTGCEAAPAHYGTCRKSHCGWIEAVARTCAQRLCISSSCRAGTVVFASLDAALQATAYWQGPCELGNAVSAQLTPRAGQHAQHEKQVQQVQQAQPHWPRRQHEADASSQRAPRSPLRKRPAPKPAIVVR